ncbi:lipase member K-like isoform X3 [Monodelphis domestica]|uniref:lipase member K-like isoform X3 n=1 Tax=Monodelphis domestica TaxID=13616 RepID=UPI0024E1E1B7|nr:lipase member K-like isoform X3 [Monodelphis domestica]
MDPVIKGRCEIQWLLADACWILLLGTAFGSTNITRVQNPEADMNISQIISYWGYPSEKYDVKTEDGFILGVFRIPYGKRNSNQTAQRPVVYLQHGMFVSASIWIANPPESSLAFALADAGCDVWMGNSRGTVWSRKHTHYSPESPKFWAFSFDEMAKYDLPATLNFILNKTSQEQLYYLGHSQGTTTAFAAFSTNPTLSSRIKLFFALAPVVSVQYSKGPLKALISIPTPILKSRLDVYLSQNPAGTSVQNIVHWRQILYSAKFQAYDWGNPAKNMAHYNQVTPPLYDLGAIKVQTVIWNGGQDLFAAPKEVEKLLPKLPKLLYYRKIPYYNHIDFLLGIDAPNEFFPEILYLINEW